MNMKGREIVTELDKISYLTGYLHAYTDLLNKPCIKETVFPRDDFPKWLRDEIEGYVRSLKKSIALLKESKS